MKVKQTLQVLGAKGFKGNVDGTNYDSTKLYVVMPVSEKNGTEAGFNAVPLAFGKEDEYQKLKNLPFPVEAELELLMTTKGLEVVGFKPLGSVRPAAPPAVPKA